MIKNYHRSLAESSANGMSNLSVLMILLIIYSIGVIGSLRGKVREQIIWDKRLPLLFSRFIRSRIQKHMAPWTNALMAKCRTNTWVWFLLWLWLAAPGFSGTKKLVTSSIVNVPRSFPASWLEVEEGLMFCQDNLFLHQQQSLFKNLIKIKTVQFNKHLCFALKALLLNNSFL